MILESLPQLVKPLKAIETKLPESTVSQEEFFQTLVPEYDVGWPKDFI